MLIDNQENGNYTAHWVPTVPGVYSVQLYVDGRHTGELIHIPQAPCSLLNMLYVIYDLPQINYENYKLMIFEEFSV